ncbi:IS66 family insertion sequence element accessory protein TnpA [Bacteroides hominis]|uniref:IS66 family insertion sequence element accessory protein TnpA n=1 Tax=Bacteroides hominis TaxID=2763023 RepID=UPI003D6C07B9
MYSRYESSGLKVRDFCTNEVINEAKFYYWQKKLRASKQLYWGVKLEMVIY